MSKFRITELEVITTSCEDGNEYYGRIKCNNGDAYWEMRGEVTDHPDQAIILVLDVFSGHGGSWAAQGNRLTPPAPVKEFVSIIVEETAETGCANYVACLDCKANGRSHRMRCYDSNPVSAMRQVWDIYNMPVDDWWGISD